MTFALVGNQNCGKTTLFNALTGSNQHVGNFPGVTVDQKMGEMRDEKGCSVVDLPGIYSLRPYTQEEIVTRDFIINQKPDGIINIVDATNIERNLYLTLSGLATGASWLCYYRALQIGQASKVVPIDKLSVVITMVLAALILKEQFTPKSILGCVLIAVGTLLMVL